MSTTERSSKAFTKSMFRAGYILAIVLVWQASLSPLMSQFGSNIQYFSQVGLNGGSTTSFTINNPSTTETITVQAQLYLPDGTPLADGQVELGPGGTETLSFGDPKAALTSGWAELKSDDAFISTEFFQLSIAGELKPRIGVLPSVASNEIRFLGFVNPQFKSGLAVSNPSSTEATEITLRVKDKTGQEPVGEMKVVLAPLECVAGFLNEEKFFGAALSNYEGVVEITTNSPGVAALAVLQAPNGDVTTVSVLTQDHIITTETNTALGIGALVSNTTGFENTATGASALGANTTGERNTASGDEALLSNIEGRSNTASGALALFSNTEGRSNTAIGASAMESNTTGERNTATGDNALAFNTTGSSNTASGASALRSNTDGIFNTASGFEALTSNTTGFRNTATGVFALSSNTEGIFNTAIGASALTSNTEGSSNTASGASALRSNTDGIFNTASGFEALTSNTTGFRNTATGVFALSSNTEGIFNTAIGASALTSNTEGISNTASGDGALFSNTTGRSNTAGGVVALADNTTGSSNTAVGTSALRGNTTGSSNIALGFSAGQDLRAGDNNIYVGNPGVAAESNTIRIGDGSIHTSAFIAGIPVAGVSSKRFKEDIRDMGQASTSLMQLRPVTFRYRKEYDAGDHRLQYGLIAEEVAEVYPELVVHDDTGRARAVIYQELNVMLLNELQKQHQVMQEQQEQIEQQQMVTDNLMERLSQLEGILTLQESLTSLTE